MNEGAVTILIIFLCVLVVSAALMFFLGVLYGKEDEKEKWHSILLRDVKKEKALKWTGTLIIAYPSKKSGDPQISVAIGSTRPYNASES